MIARRLRMRTASKSSIRRLVAYLTDSQQHNQRVLSVRMNNCEADSSAEWAAFEMQATQNQNTRANGDRTYHLVLSFREEPSARALEEIEARICDKLGYAEHQRVSVLHGDTDNLHLHLAINKIHPSKLTLHEPYYDHKTLAKLCVTLEQQYGLMPDNHIPKTQARDSSAKSMEIAGDIESLTGWIQRECLEGLKRCATWDELHDELGRHSLEIKPRGNGFVITSGTLTVKASSVDRMLSKKRLEERLGEFAERQSVKQAAVKQYVKRPMQHATHGHLWEQYKQWRDENEKKRAQALAQAQERVESEASLDASMDDLQRTLIKHAVKGTAFKRILYAMQNNERLRRQAKAHSTRERKAAFRQHPNLTWRGWLQQQAMSGNPDALDAMRVRKKSAPTGNFIKSRPRPQPHVPPDAVKVTHRGTVLFADGCRDTGHGMLIPKRTGDEGVRAGLTRTWEAGQLAAQGTDDFLAAVVREASALNLPFSAFAEEATRLAVLQERNGQNSARAQEQHMRR